MITAKPGGVVQTRQVCLPTKEFHTDNNILFYPEKILVTLEAYFEPGSENFCYVLDADDRVKLLSLKDSAFLSLECRLPENVSLKITDRSNQEPLTIMIDRVNSLEKVEEGGKVYADKGGYLTPIPNGCEIEWMRFFKRVDSEGYVAIALFPELRNNKSDKN